MELNKLSIIIRTKTWEGPGFPSKWSMVPIQESAILLRLLPMLSQPEAIPDLLTRNNISFWLLPMDIIRVKLTQTLIIVRMVTTFLISTAEEMYIMLPGFRIPQLLKAEE